MAVRQLAERNSDGIVVELLWNDSAPVGRDVFVEYRDEPRGVFYTLYPRRDRALEAFHHPNAFAEDAERARSSPQAAA